MVRHNVFCFLHFFMNFVSSLRFSGLALLGRNVRPPRAHELAGVTRWRRGHRARRQAGAHARGHITEPFNPAFQATEDGVYRLRIMYAVADGWWFHWLALDLGVYRP